MGSWAERMCGKARSQTKWVRQWLVDRDIPHLSADKPGGTPGQQDGLHNPGFQLREIKASNL